MQQHYEFQLYIKNYYQNYCFYCDNELGKESAHYCQDCGKANHFDEKAIIHEFRQGLADSYNAINDDSILDRRINISSYSDLTEFSKKYPNLLFTIKGHNKENNDHLTLYVLNGFYQKIDAENDINKLVLTF